MVKLKISLETIIFIIELPAVAGWASITIYALPLRPYSQFLRTPFLSWLRASEVGSL